MEDSPVDFNELAQGIEQMLEVTRALVAALKEDGFTDREARMITASLFASKAVD